MAESSEVWPCSSCTYFNSIRYPSCKQCKTRRQPGERKVKMYSDIFSTDDGCSDEIRLMLLGRTGSGKSASGNTILGDDFFPSVMSGSGVTRECKLSSGKWRGIDIRVLDTPGIFDIEFTEEQFKIEMAKCVGLTAPGPHAFLFVTRLGRFTEEEQASVEYFSKLFGDELFKYMIIVFTGKDELDRNNTSLHKFLQSAPVKLNEWLSKCDGRCVTFDNTARSSEKSGMVDKLLDMVTKMGRGKSRPFYTNEMYNSAETIIVKETEEMLEIRKAEYERQREELQRSARENDRASRSINKGGNQLWKDEEQLQVMEARLESLRMCQREGEESSSEIEHLQSEIEELKERHRLEKDDMERKMEDLQGKLNSQRRKEKALQADIANLRRQLRSEARRNLQSGNGKSTMEIVQVVGERAWEVVKVVAPIIYPLISDIVRRKLGLDISKIVPGVLAAVRTFTKK